MMPIKLGVGRNHVNAWSLLGEVDSSASEFVGVAALPFNFRGAKLMRYVWGQQVACVLSKKMKLMMSHVGWLGIGECRAA